jgi:hypothetical protein
VVADQGVEAAERVERCRVGAADVGGDRLGTATAGRDLILDPIERLGPPSH